MNIHKNARLTFARRIEMVRDILERGLTPCAAADAYGVSVPTVRKWLGRYLAQGEAGLVDRSSRPQVQSARDRSGQGAGDRGAAPPASDAGAHRRKPGRVQEHRGPRAARVRACRGCAIWSPASRWCATSMSIPGIWSTSTPRSSDASSAWATASPATRATPPTGPAGSTCSWPSMTMLASASPTCIPMSAPTAPCSSCTTPWPTSDR